METPTYAVAEVDFTDGTNLTTRNIETVVAVCPSSNSFGDSLVCGIRDYEIQILSPPVTAGGDGLWHRVKSVGGNTSEWVLYAHLDTAMMARAVRIVIKDVNNRSFNEDKNWLLQSDGTPIYASSMHPALYELEAYGPTN